MMCMCVIGWDKVFTYEHARIKEQLKQPPQRIPMQIHAVYRANGKG